MDYLDTYSVPPKNHKIPYVEKKMTGLQSERQKLERNKQTMPLLAA